MDKINAIHCCQCGKKLKEVIVIFPLSGKKIMFCKKCDRYFSEREELNLIDADMTYEEADREYAKSKYSRIRNERKTEKMEKINILRVAVLSTLLFIAILTLIYNPPLPLLAMPFLIIIAMIIIFSALEDHKTKQRMEQIIRKDAMIKYLNI